MGTGKKKITVHNYIWRVFFPKIITKLPTEIKLIHRMKQFTRNVKNWLKDEQSCRH